MSPSPPAVSEPAPLPAQEVTPDSPLVQQLRPRFAWLTYLANVFGDSGALDAVLQARHGLDVAALQELNLQGTAPVGCPVRGWRQAKRVQRRVVLLIHREQQVQQVQRPHGSLNRHRLRPGRAAHARRSRIQPRSSLPQ